MVIAMVTDRRRILQAGMASLCCGTRRATAREDQSYRGCTLTSAEMVVQEAKPNFSSYYQGQIALHGSGNERFDRALAVSLKMISDTFSVLPGFAFSERVILNAFASPKTDLGRQDGSVVFGNSLYRRIMERREHPEIGIVAVCAHEFGHIAQFKNRIPERLVACGRCSVKRLELQPIFWRAITLVAESLRDRTFPQPYSRQHNTVLAIRIMGARIITEVGRNAVMRS
jgi:hypothetical protein